MTLHVQMFTLLGYVTWLRWHSSMVCRVWQSFLYTCNVVEPRRASVAHMRPGMQPAPNQETWPTDLKLRYTKGQVTEGRIGLRAARGTGRLLQRKCKRLHTTKEQCSHTGSPNLQCDHCRTNSYWELWVGLTDQWPLRTDIQSIVSGTSHSGVVTAFINLQPLCYICSCARDILRKAWF